jgi:hypothetical protein
LQRDSAAALRRRQPAAAARLNAERLDDSDPRVMLVNGNDERGIDMGIITKTGFRIGTIGSHVYAEDAVGVILSRDCPDYQITTTSGTTIHVLVKFRLSFAFWPRSASALWPPDRMTVATARRAQTAKVGRGATAGWLGR